MYWPTSFCERENSSKRWRISSESVSAVVPVLVTGDVFAGAREVPSAAAPSRACGLHPQSFQGALPSLQRSLSMSASL